MLPSDSGPVLCQLDSSSPQDLPYQAPLDSELTQLGLVHVQRLDYKLAETSM